MSSFLLFDLPEIQMIVINHANLFQNISSLDVLLPPQQSSLTHDWI